MVFCCAHGCKSRNDRKEAGITFHRFPKDPERAKLWIQNTKLADWNPTSIDRLCSKHFENDLFYQTDEKVRLLHGAVPTIFPELPLYMQPKQKRKRRIRKEFNGTTMISSTPSTSTIMRQEVDSPRTKKLKEQPLREVTRSREKNREIRVLGQTVSRYKKKISCIKLILKELKSKNLLCDEHLSVLSGLPTIIKHLWKHQTQKRKKYSPHLRTFAISLSFFSPKGYDYVRDTFDSCLPHRSTIGKWFKNVNAEPGFTQEAFESLKQHVLYSDKPVILSLIIDEISIRKHVEWDGKRFHGYVHFGVDLQDDTNAMAKEAFVLLVACINGQWKLPVGYFFVDGLSGDQKCGIVTQCIKFISETGAQVSSLTFDGAPSNVSMAQALGCKLTWPELKPYFDMRHKSIFIFYDPCHMVKLVRNTFEEKKSLIDGEGNKIYWEYIEQLEKLQDSEGLHLGNKLRKRHLNFFKQKMNLKLAVQLLSESVADALLYCEEQLKSKQFIGCKATANFIKMFNYIFYILNSRSINPPGYKKALCEKNILSLTTFINKAISYISLLKFSDGQLVITSKRKTGFIGLIISLKSSLLLYEDLIAKQHTLIYLPLYKISQDHLELFFNSIRSQGRYNNNCTARQFTAAYKRVLEISTGRMGSCIALEDIPIMAGFNRFENPISNINCSVISSDQDNLLESENIMQVVLKDHQYIMNPYVLSECSEQIIIYIAGFVSHHLQIKIKCEHCIGAVLGNQENFLNPLIERKTHRGLKYPSKDVIDICKVAEHFLRVSENNLTRPNFVKVLMNKIMYFCIEENFFHCLNEHVLNSSNNHVYFLIESVIKQYLDVRLHFITKRKSEISDPIRNLLSKLILFKGQ